MVALYWFVKIYRFVIFGWALMTWIPGVAGSSFHQLVHLVVWPVVAPFNFLQIGGIGLGPIIPLVLLGFVETWLGKRAGIIEEEQQGHPVQEAAIVDVRDMRRAPDTLADDQEFRNRPLQ
jgi:uncharacterized protein YggT (Ycf19 family)